VLVWSFQFLGIPPKGEPGNVPVDAPGTFRDCFQFLGIPPKGELEEVIKAKAKDSSRFQFLGIPPKGEPVGGEVTFGKDYSYLFPISRDPPEGGTSISSWL